MNNKKNIIIISVILAAILGLVIFFAVRSHKEIKKIEDENNYTYTFNYYVDKKLNQKITFIYENKKLKDITATVYFESEKIAKLVLKEYKKAKDFKDYKQDKNKVILYYKDADVKLYKGYNKEELIQEFESMGYVYKDKKSNK